MKLDATPYLLMQFGFPIMILNLIRKDGYFVINSTVKTHSHIDITVDHFAVGNLTAVS